MCKQQIQQMHLQRHNVSLAVVAAKVKVKDSITLYLFILSFKFNDNCHFDNVPFAYGKPEMAYVCILDQE